LYRNNRSAASIPQNSPSDRTVESRKVEPLTWVLVKPHPTSPAASPVSDPEFIVSPDSGTPVGMRRTESSGRTADKVRGDLGRHREWDEPSHVTRVDSWSPGPRATLGSLLYVNGRNLLQVEVYLDGIPLEVEARREWSLDLRLPDYPVTGSLEYYDPATSEYHVLADTFSVEDMELETFDVIVPHHALGPGSDPIKRMKVQLTGGW